MLARVGAKVAKKSFKEIMDEELAKDVKPETPKVDEPPKDILPSETTQEFLRKREDIKPETARRQYGLMSKLKTTNGYHQNRQALLLLFYLLTY